jgi:leader peptidase (prepilin peptidase)/N-methyltransferase
LTVLGVLAAALLYVFGLPHLQARGNPLLSPDDLIMPRAIDVIVVIWCFWVGSSVGSFLNVVAWRMPRGESINGRSHCPRCQAQLRARDNLPVFGWLALGGRCRNCRLPISVRYPIVEAAVGLSITAVCIAELYQLSLPGQLVHVHRGPLRAPVVDLEILVTLLYHCVALSVAWACGLIRLDGHRLPKQLVGFAATVTLVPMVAYPTLMVVPWQMQVGTDWQPHGLFLDAMVRVVTALVAATILGRYLARVFCPAADPKLDPLGRSTARLMDLIVILSIPAIVVGWQAIIAVTVIASLLAAVLGRFLRPPREALGRFAVAMPLAMSIQLVFWRHLHAPASLPADSSGTWYWPSDGGSPWVLLSWAGIAVLIPLWLRETEQSRVARSENSMPALDVVDWQQEAPEATVQLEEEDPVHTPVEPGGDR